MGWTRQQGRIDADDRRLVRAVALHRFLDNFSSRRARSRALAQTTTHAAVLRYSRCNGGNERPVSYVCSSSLYRWSFRWRDRSRSFGHQGNLEPPRKEAVVTAHATQVAAQQTSSTQKVSKNEPALAYVSGNRFRFHRVRNFRACTCGALLHRAVGSRTPNQNRLGAFRYPRPCAGGGCVVHQQHQRNACPTRHMSFHCENP